MTTRRLIEDIGKNNVLDLLPPLFQLVDTSEIPNILVDTSFFVSPGSVIDSLYISLASGLHRPKRKMRQIF
jgi:hypothetical protein